MACRGGIPTTASSVPLDAHILATASIFPRRDKHQALLQLLAHARSLIISTFRQESLEHPAGARYVASFATAAPPKRFVVWRSIQAECAGHRAPSAIHHARHFFAA